MQEQGLQGNETRQRVSQVRDKFEYDRERRMRDRGWSFSWISLSFLSVRPYAPYYLLYLVCL